MAEVRRIRMSRNEVDEIFLRVPQFYEFHKSFYNEVSNEMNIGRVFLRQIDFFKGYVPYMMECAKTIKKMGECERDKNLHISLERIKHRSNFKDEDMVDLLLIPLKRIMEYKEILNSICNIADKTNVSEYDCLEKASRRIGRIATYISNYKDGLLNRNEMNKIQLLLGAQCNIRNPKRRIVRRGMMTRRTTGLTARKKHYIFFLFNDLLLWTSMSGILKNVIRLSNCEVLPSIAKLNPERKFRIISRGQRYKNLLLECKSVKQRDAWYAAVEKKVSAVKIMNEEASPNVDLQANIADENSEDEEVVDDEMWGKSTNTASLPDIRRKKCSVDDSQNEEKFKFSAELPVTSTYQQLQCPLTFADKDLPSFDTFDDTMSIISEYDVSFHESNTKHNVLQNCSKIGYQRSNSHILQKTNSRLCKSMNLSSKRKGENIGFGSSLSPSIIRRNKSLPKNVKDLEDSASNTIRLDRFAKVCKEDCKKH